MDAGYHIGTDSGLVVHLMSTPMHFVTPAPPIQMGSGTERLDYPTVEKPNRDELYATEMVSSEGSAGIRREHFFPTEWTSGQSLTFSVVKRTLDVTISLAALTLLSPVILLTALVIRLFDRGPVFFCQKRVGLNGSIFQCFKFRSMIVDAQSVQETLSAANSHADARTFKMFNDPRVTPIGQFLRRFSIDELPQFLNVLFGEMSVVGPRPSLPLEVALYSEADRQRLMVKPGLTCIWQISGRSRLPFTEQARLDIAYIQKQSVLLDLEIILRTIPAVLSGDGAA